MLSKTDKTMIQVSKETRSRLHAIGKKGESYDDIIQRLLYLVEQLLGEGE